MIHTDRNKKKLFLFLLQKERKYRACNACTHIGNVAKLDRRTHLHQAQSQKGKQMCKAKKKCMRQCVHVYISHMQKTFANIGPV